MLTEKDKQKERKRKEKELVLKNNIKNLKSGINELKKLEQEKQNLVEEVNEVQTKLNVTLASIESAKKSNENYLERFKNLQSLYRSSEEKLINKVKRLKKKYGNIHQELEDTIGNYLKEKNEIEPLRRQLLISQISIIESRKETLKEKTKATNIGGSGPQVRARNNYNHEEQGPGRGIEKFTPKGRNIPGEKRFLPCRICKDTTHSGLFGCADFKKYIPGGPNGASSLSKDICKFCLGTVFNECKHNELPKIWMQAF